MKPDAIFAFVMSLVTTASSLFTSDPKVSLVLQMAGGILGVIGHALHLDGQ